MTNEEQPVAVQERSDDLDGGDMTFTEHITGDGPRVVNPTGNVVPSMPSPANEPQEAPQSHSSTTSAELYEANEDHMDPIEPNMQFSYLPDEFMQNLNEKHNKRKIEKKNARGKL